MCLIAEWLIVIPQVLPSCPLFGHGSLASETRVTGSLDKVLSTRMCIIDARREWLLDLITMIVTSAATGTAASNPMTPVGMGAVIAGTLVFLTLGVFVAHASYKRRKQHDWNVKVWQMNEPMYARKKSLQDSELMH